MQRRNKAIKHKVKKSKALKTIKKDVFSSKFKLKRTSRRRVFWIIPAALVISFVTFVGVRILTMDESSDFTLTFSLPELANVSNIFSVQNGSFATTIDGLVVTGQNADTVQPTASTAKMVLGLAIMREKPFALGELGETITIDDEDYERYLWYIDNNGSNTAVEVGEEISEYAALASVFLASSNNMADTLARWGFGSLEAYREYASAMLAEWGLSHTTPGSDASGYDENWTSTASELAEIGAKVMSDPVLSQIVGLSEYEVPVAGVITNTNGTLGQLGINGVKTGYIGEISGYNLVSNYDANGHLITTARLGAETRETSFNDTLLITQKLQDLVRPKELIIAGQMVGYTEDWWNGKLFTKAANDLMMLAYDTENNTVTYEIDGGAGALTVKIGNSSGKITIETTGYRDKPSFWEKFMHVFGWKKEISDAEESETADQETEVEFEEPKEPAVEPLEEEPEEVAIVEPITAASDDNCTIPFGKLMLINPNFTIGLDFIGERRYELVSLSENFGISEYHYYNGDNLLDADAASHINMMLTAYKEYNPGHEMQTVSCFRSRGTSCGRLCAATGASDHHTGLTCDLIDPDYGDSLDTDTYEDHVEWQWLKANSYKYGFIDRFPEAWAGGPMSEPLNVDEYGSTGLFETWHYRYVGVEAATEIATGKYNNGEYDSLEHYLLARGLISDLKNGICAQ